MTELKDEHLEVISKNKSRKYEIDNLVNQLSDAKESVAVLGNAIECGFLHDKHSLILQEWIVEYEQLPRSIGHTLNGGEETMDERAMRMLLAGKQLEIDKLKRTIKEMEENDNARQRDSETRKTSKRTTKSSDSN